MKLKVAVIGYGNVGKQLATLAEQDEQLDLVAVVSRRKIEHPLAVKWQDLPGVHADVLMLALGSFDDLLPNLHHFARFDTVDCFDEHDKILPYKQLLQQTKPNKISLCACGWDPGLMSVARGIAAVGGGYPQTFWGKGISQGHSNALHNLPGVLDAVQVTVPPETTCAKAQHKRICYVACVEQDKQAIEQAILQCNYFSGKVEIVFCTTSEVRKIKQDTSHAGRVVAQNDGYFTDFKLKIANNAQFTAQIMLACAKAIPQLRQDGLCGPMDMFDLPIRYLAQHNLL